MATTLSSTKLGEVTPGWSVDAQATPNIPGEPPVGTGVARFTTAIAPNVEFAVNDQNTLGRQGVGFLTGPIGSVSTARISSTISQGTILTKLNANVPKGVILGGTRGLKMHFEEAVASLSTATVTYLSASDPVMTFPIWRGNVWQHLNEMCSATGREMTVDDNVIIIRDVGDRMLELEEFVAGASPRITVEANANAYEIEVVNQNARQVTNGELYNARLDDNAMYEVGVRDTVVYSVVTNCYPTTLLFPSPVTKVWPNTTVSPGTYAVSASDGRAIPADIWTAFGGRVRATVGKNAPNVLDIHIKGPDWLIPSYEAPYRLSSSDTVNDYATLSIMGTGVVVDPKPITLFTGAIPNSVSGTSNGRIESIFLSNTANTYNRIGWALMDAAGPSLRLSATIPISSAITGLSVTVGARFRYNDQNWRITDSTLTNTSVQITAVAHTTCAEMDALWAGQTCDQYDAFWAGYKAEDPVIAPLRK